MISSFVYILNDYFDYKSDILHPVKRKRPLASGQINKHTALIIASLLLIFGEIIAYKASSEFLWVFQVYIAQNILYSVFFKKIIIIDLLIVSLGYIWRVYLGGMLTDIPISKWLYLMTFLITLTIVIGKRYTDMHALSSNSDKTRNFIFVPYSSIFLKVWFIIILIANLIAYIAYTLYPETIERIGSTWYFLTTVPVAIGLWRYAYQILAKKNSASPIRLLFKDYYLFLCMLIWIGLTYIFNYSFYA